MPTVHIHMHRKPAHDAAPQTEGEKLAAYLMSYGARSVMTLGGSTAYKSPGGMNVIVSEDGTWQASNAAGKHVANGRGLGAYRTRMMGAKDSRTADELGLWRKNRITGYWVRERGVTPETQAQWLEIFKRDAPGEQFKISATKPRDAGDPEREELEAEIRAQERLASDDPDDAWRYERIRKLKKAIENLERNRRISRSYGDHHAKDAGRFKVLKQTPASKLDWSGPGSGVVMLQPGETVTYVASGDKGHTFKTASGQEVMVRNEYERNISAKPTKDEYQPSGARKYPSYMTAELEKAVAEGRGTPAMVEEIAARKSGASKPRVTPQIMGGKPVPKVGRM